MSSRVEDAMDTVLLTACIDGDLQRVRQLLELSYSADCRDSRDRSCLHVAAGRGHSEVLVELLCAGAAVDAVDFQGNTALHYCSHMATVSMLLQYGADIHSRNKLDVTPAEAMRRRRVDKSVVDYLESFITTEPSHDDMTEPFLQTSRLKKPSHQVWGHIGAAKSLWMEFCQDLGAGKLVLVIMLCLLFSLYVAYVMTGLAKQRDAPIALNDNVYQSELR